MVIILIRSLNALLVAVPMAHDDLAIGSILDHLDTGKRRAAVAIDVHRILGPRDYILQSAMSFAQLDGIGNVRLRDVIAAGQQRQQQQWN
jgi:hypothetical protein